MAAELRKAMTTSTYNRGSVELAFCFFSNWFASYCSFIVLQYYRTIVYLLDSVCQDLSFIYLFILNFYCKSNSTEQKKLSVINYEIKDYRKEI